MLAGKRGRERKRETEEQDRESEERSKKERKEREKERRTFEEFLDGFGDAVLQLVFDRRHADDFKVLLQTEGASGTEEEISERERK
jgi:serine/threonine-protein kinase RIO1